MIVESVKLIQQIQSEKKFPCFVALTSFKNEEIEYPMQVKQSINHHFCTLTIWEILKCFEHFVELNNLKTSVRWRYHDIMMGNDIFIRCKSSDIHEKHRLMSA